MLQLENGMNVYNGTPHDITLWDGEGDLIIVPPHGKIDAKPQEVTVADSDFGVTLVTTEFVPTKEGWKIINQAKKDGANVIIGSIVAAQAYPGNVFAMTPAPGFERVPPPLPRDVMEALERAAHQSEDSFIHEVLGKYSNLPTKRMNLNKFTVFLGDE